jgi:hypothetical protein
MAHLPTSLKKNTIYEIVKGDTTFFVSDNYFYKSEAYYRIVHHEIQGRRPVPSSKDLIEAFVVPICLEKARMHDIRICPWEVSYSYAPLPSIAYGIHYYADPAEYSILREGEVAREVINHITNHGRYPFCYIGVFGETTEEQPELRHLARAIYAAFMIPFLSITVTRDEGKYALSSLSNAKYSKLSPEDRILLQSHLEVKPSG